MGRSITWKYRIEMQATGGYYTPARWDTKHAGRPTDLTLARHIELFEASTREGGCNAHLGAVTVTSAEVIRQADATVVAAYTRPALAAAAA